MPQLRTLHVTALFDLDRFALASAPLLEVLNIEFIEDGGGLTQLVFSSLRSLTICSGEMWPLAHFRADKLDTLCVVMPSINAKKASGIVTRLLSEPEYTLSPLTLYLNLPLETEYIVWFLRRAPRVKQLFLLFDAKVRPRMKEFVKELSSQRHQAVTGKEAVNLWRLCPDLTNIYFQLNWVQDDLGHWKSQAEKILKGRSAGALEKVTCKWSDGKRLFVTIKETRGSEE
jgi:hypothetical protein